jgi:hypothetical protein
MIGKTIIHGKHLVFFFKSHQFLLFRPEIQLHKKARRKQRLKTFSVNTTFISMFFFSPLTFLIIFFAKKNQLNSS